MRKLIAGVLASSIIAACAPAAMAGSAGAGTTLTPDAQRFITAALGLTATTDEATLLPMTVIYLRPDLNLASLGVGLDLSIAIRNDGTTQFTESLKDSIRYLSLGHKGSTPLYIRAGNIDAATIGTGILVDNYSNLTLDESTRGAKNLGLAFDFDVPVVGMESVLAKAPFLNDDKRGLTAYRVYIKPLPFIRIGASMAKDDSPIPGLSTPVSAMAVDAELHIGKNLLVPYVSAAKFTDKGNGDPKGSGEGYSAGLRGGFDLGAMKLQYKGEARLSAADFVPSLWDFTYETDKADGTVGSRLATEPGDATIGLMGQASLTVPPLGLTIVGQMENSQRYTGDLVQVLDLAPKVVAEASLNDKISIPVAGGKLSLGARYEGVISRSSDDLGKVKAMVTWRAPIGLTIAFINQTSYAKGQAPVKALSVQGGFSF